MHRCRVERGCMPFVSILVPVYNVEKYLPRCLDSLVGQTFTDLEIILINDGSKDSSLKIAREYASHDPRIRIYSYENSGISKTRNRALSHAQGEYIMFVDSDDFIDLKMVETMVETARREKADLVQCGFVMDYFFGPFYRPSTGRTVCGNIEALHDLVKNRHFNNYPWGKLTRRSCFEGIAFPEDMPGFEDTYTIFKTIAAAQKLCVIPDRFYHYVQHSGSLTNNMSLHMVYLMRKAYQYQASWLKEHFPNEQFSFDLQYYNTDMVIIYTLIVFSKRKDNPQYIPDQIDWKKLPAPALYRLAYQAWLGIARLKLSDKILSGDGR